LPLTLLLLIQAIPLREETQNRHVLVTALLLLEEALDLLPAPAQLAKQFRERVLQLSLVVSNPLKACITNGIMDL
jgi:hypothetical protein